MKNSYQVAVFLILLLYVGAPAARAQQAALPDSVAEKRIVTAVGSEMCRQLEAENAKKPIASLSPAESQQLFMRLIMTSAATSPELMDVFVNQPDVAKSYGEDVGRKIGFWLLRECPVSQSMLMQLGVQSVQRKSPLTPAEESVLKPMAVDVCRFLTERQAHQDLKSLDAAARQQLFQESLVATLRTHKKELELVYGKKAMQDSRKQEELGRKLATQMATQCPDMLLILSNLK